MKDLKDIERLSIEELTEIAGNSAAKAPASLGEDLSWLIDAAAAAEDAGRKVVRLPFRRIAPFAAAVAATLAIFVTYPSHPKDSFDDPALAYAELEKTFAYMSRKTGNALKMARVESDNVMEKTIEMLDF